MLQDEAGVAVFPDNSLYGFFIFQRLSGKDGEEKPYIVIAEVGKCHSSQSKTGWRANLRRLGA